MDIKCKVCGKRPSEISEYIDAGEIEDMTPEDFVIENEGTYNPETGKFYCTGCYIKIGEPLGRA
jgi:hypothetical protein